MYREIADCPEPVEKKSWSLPAKEDMDRIVFGVGGASLVVCVFFYLVGIGLHCAMVPNPEKAHVDPLVVRICWYAGGFFASILALGALYIASRFFYWFILVALGKEKP